MLHQGIIIAFTAMSLLSLEVAWMRLFAIESFSSFGYMILSIALLGFGMGGAGITLFSPRFMRDKTAWLARFSAALPVTIVASFVGSRYVPFVPQNILQDTSQFAYIGMFYALLSLPFVAGSLTIGLILTTAGEKVGKLYFADLVGSGLGGLVVLASFYLLRPQYLPLLTVVLSLPALGAAAAGPGLGLATRIVPAALGLVSAGLLTSTAQLNFSEYKGISYALATAEVSGARVEAEAQGPLGYLQVVDSTTERTAPALSAQAPLEAMPPIQKGLYIDGGKIGSLARALAPEEALYLDWLLTSIPFALCPEHASVLLVGLGGGEGVAQALHFRAESVDVAEINSVLVDLVMERYAGYNGNLLSRPGVGVEVTDGRELAQRSPGRYDLVVVSFLDASGISFPGAKSLSENYLYTKEALRLFLDALNDRGMLVLSTRTEEPPRGSLRLFASLVAVARDAWGLEGARGGLAYVKSQFHGMALALKGGFEQEQVDLLLQKCFETGFAASYFPGMQRETLEKAAQAEEAFWADFKEKEGVDLSAFDAPDDVQDPYFDCATAMLYGEDGGRGYIDAYPFDITATADDRPYFSAMLKAGSFDFIRKSAYDPERWTREVPPDLWAQPLVLATLGQAVLFALLILAVTVLAGRKRMPGTGKLRCLVYFSCLGIGFMFVEMVLIQRFTLYVAAPAYAAAIVLSGMLVFSGIGAGFSSRFARAPDALARGILAAVCGVVALTVIYNLGLMPLLNATMGLPEWARIVLSVAAVAPVGFVLGMPFPLAMASLSLAGREDLSGWGWAVNGALSVIGVVLAQTAAMEIGFSAVMWLSAAVYLLALAAFPRRVA